MPSQTARKDLSLKGLELFQITARKGSLQDVSEETGLSVSTISHHLRNLEDHLGVELFNHSRRPMVLTAAGETLLHHARRMLFDLEKMGLELDEHRQGMRGYVRMLANLSAIIQFLPEDLHDFTISHERVKVDLEERPSTGVVQGLIDGVADIGICSEDTDVQGLYSVPYKPDELVVVMRPDHALAQRDHVAFEDTLDSDHIGLHAASSINMRTHTAARSHGKPLRVRIHVPGFDAMCRMVQANMGIGVLPRKAFDLLGTPLGLRAVGLSDTWAKRTLILVVRDKAALSPVSLLLFDHLQQHRR